MSTGLRQQLTTRAASGWASPWRLEALASSSRAVAAVAALAALAFIWWMEPFAALGTALVVGAATAVGLGLTAGARTASLPLLARAALGAVVAAASLSLASLGLALLSIPVHAVSVATVALVLAALTVAAAARKAHDTPPVAEDGGQLAGAARTPARPTRAALASCAVISASALLVLPPLHQAALVAYTGTFLWALAAARPEHADEPGGEREPGAAGGQHHRLRYTAWLVVAALAVLLLSRLVPFLRSPAPLGYDTGLYRAVQHDFIAALPFLPTFAPGSWGDVQPPGLFILSNLLHLAGASPDALLWGLLILIQLVGAIGIWLLGREIGGTRVATWALILFILSSAQFVLFYQVYFKQILALALLPYALVLWRRESWLAIPVGAFLAATHTMGFLLLGLVLLSDAAWGNRRGDATPRARRARARQFVADRSYRLLTGSSILAVGLASYAFAPRAITEFVTPDVGQTLSQFGLGGEAGAGSYRLDAGSYALLVLPLIPFSALTVAQGWRDPRLRLVMLWAGWATAFVALDLIFARRFIGSLDPAFTVLAAVAIARLSSGAARSIRPFVAVAVLASAVFLVRAVDDLGPAIAIEDLRDLESASQALPREAYLMAVSGADMPWVRGYGRRDTIAPGFLEHDRWTREEWGTFWFPPSPEDRYALLERYDRPIYVFMRGERPLPSIAADPRFTRVSRTLWRYLPAEETG